MRRAPILVLASLMMLAIPAKAIKPVLRHTHQIIAIETRNSSLLLQTDQKGSLRTVHYGARVTDPDQFLRYDMRDFREDSPGALTYPAAGGRFSGLPALEIRYPDGTCNTELVFVESRTNGNKTLLTLVDEVTSIQVDLIYEAFPDEDVIVSHAEIRNNGRSPVSLASFASSSMTVGATKYLLTHTHGSWASEMNVDRELLGHDTKVLESRRGVQTAQTNNPSFMLSLDTAEWNETNGEVIAGALAWSGNWRICFEQPSSGLMNIVAGIHPYASQYPLAPGDQFITPDMIWTWSGKGAGQASRNLHRWARKNDIYGGGEVNPTLLNSWEGAYFNFSTGTLLGMIDDAASMGLEMFVLDDGWFGTRYPRNNDDAGLGDWELNTLKLPEGIDYVASYAHRKGLKFGIWIEPEMVNPNSTLAHAHPEWVVQSPGREKEQIRHQWILDLSNPQVQDFVFGVFDRTMQLSGNIDYIKWDCNRKVTSFGSTWLGKEQDRFYIEYIQGFYKVMQRVRDKYPSVIVQCCSSGGARVDYGSLRWFNEIWGSDNTDADCRIRIQYGTSLIYPSCIVASHVSAVPNHQTQNVTPLKFRFDVACAGRLGMELQPKNLTEAERALADKCIRSYKTYRDLVFKGDLYRLVSPYDGEFSALMYVSEDQSKAVVFLYCLSHRHRSRVSPVFKLQGLDPKRRYKVTEQNVDRSCWWGNGETFTGDFLASGGFNPHMERPHASAVFVLEAN